MIDGRREPLETLTGWDISNILTTLGVGEYQRCRFLFGLPLLEGSLTWPQPVYAAWGLVGVARTLMPYILIALGIRWLYTKLKERANADGT